MTQTQWSSTKRWMNNVADELPDAPDCAGYIYAGNTCICRMEDGRYWLIIGNYEAIHAELEPLETELFQWCEKQELFD